MQPIVFSTHLSSWHSFSKAAAKEIELITGHGVRGDAHEGELVQHLSRMPKKDGDLHPPNQRQVHLMAWELFTELDEQGFNVRPGDLGENITTFGLDLVNLPRGTILHIGEAALEVTGLRNPCRQINDFQPGLMQAVTTTEDIDGKKVVTGKAGIMSIVREGGLVAPLDYIKMEYPEEPFEPLRIV